MEGFHHDAHQQLCTSPQLEERKPIHLGQKPHAADVSFADLPQPWWKLLVQQVEPKHRHALFSTCSGTAAAVVQHSPALTLKPDVALQQDSNRRAFALKLAANSNNICLHAADHAIPLDLPDIWQSIKQLLLCDVDLNADTISTLHLQQLKHLHTIQFWAGRGVSAVDTVAVQRLMQAGGLPALHTLKCLGIYPGSETQLLLLLGPVLGHRVTELVVESCYAITSVHGWPGLQKVQVQVQAGWGCYDCDAIHSAVVKNVFEHPQLKEAVLPSHMFSHASSTNSASYSAGKLDVLELKEQAGRNPLALSEVPLHAVKHLRIPTSITANRLATATVQHLRQCSMIEVVPSTWEHVSDRYSFDSINYSTPTWEATYSPVHLDWLLPLLNKAEGALILSCEPEVLGQGLIGRLHIACLRLIPLGIHTLVFDSCAVGMDCTWGQLIAQVPQQVQSLLLCNCAFTQEQFEGVLAQPPPAGLQRLYLARWIHSMPWVAEQSDAVAAAVSAKWPGVQLYCKEEEDVGEEEEQEEDEEEEEEEHDEGEEEEWDDEDEAGGYFGRSFGDIEDDESDEYEDECEDGNTDTHKDEGLDDGGADDNDNVVNNDAHDAEGKHKNGQAVGSSG